MAQTPPEFEGWATYPSSMSLLAGDGDTKEYGRRLAQAEKSLFVDETKEGMEIEVLQLGSPRQGQPISVSLLSSFCPILI
jgi:hypothetical protein